MNHREETVCIFRDVQAYVFFSVFQPYHDGDRQFIYDRAFGKV